MSIFFAILLFSFLIFIHELGHFIAAKRSGVQVNEFALFMGPAIVKWKRGETLYSIRCIPFGGYCAMEGEDEDTDNPRSFQKAAWWKRLIILVAGSSMNLIAGFLIMVIVCLPMSGVVMPTIDSFEDFSTVNGEDGLMVGDRIVEVDGERIFVQSDFSMILALNPGNVHDLVIDRNGNRIILNDFQMEKHLFVDEDGTERMLYGINFTLDEDLTLADKLSYSLNCSLNTVRTVRLSLQMLFSGAAKLNDMTGPVGLVAMMSDTVDQADQIKDAILNFLYFGAFISINLGIMNLLPIPALDGGRAVGLILTTAIEKISKKKVSPKVEGYIHGIGLILLLGLMLVITFKDVFNVFKG